MGLEQRAELHGREQTAEKTDLKPKLLPGVAQVGLIWWKIPANNGSGWAGGVLAVGKASDTSQVA